MASTVRLGGGGSCAKTSRNECAGSTEMTVVFLLLANCRAMEAEQVVLPTPPLPARKVRRRSAGVPPAGSAASRRRDGGGPAGGTPALHCRILSAESSGAHARGAS